jgi:2,5-dihydroxypyridine 5,6-dioxygenase
MFDYQAVDLLDAFTRELELCALSSGEHAVVLTEPSTRPDYAAAAFGAAKALGATVVAITASAGTPDPTPSTHTGAGLGLLSVLNDTVTQSLLRATDLVIDLTREGFIHAPLQQTILDSGTRILFVCDAPDVLIRNMPTAKDKSEVLAAATRVRESNEMTVTSPAGTHLTVNLTNCHPGYQTGFADDPGRWDHWPSKMCLFWPEFADGVIVLAPGDILLPFKEFVRSKVVLDVASGHIEKISGGADAAILEAYMTDSDDKWARYTSHMGWGMMRTADWFATEMYGKHEIMGMDARAYAGNFLWSTGPQPHLGRDSYAHLDIAMRGCTIALDGQPVVVNGLLVD